MALGMLGFLARRNLIVMFLSAEMMLQGTALTLVGFGRYHGNWTGQVFTIVILTVAACEASIALALILVLFNRRSSLDVTLWQDLREPGQPEVRRGRRRGRADRGDPRPRVVPGPDPRRHRAAPPARALDRAPRLRRARRPRADSSETIDRDGSRDVSEFLIRNAWLVPFFPLLGGVDRRRRAGDGSGGAPHLPVVVGIGLAFLVSLGLLIGRGAGDDRRSSARWIDVSRPARPDRVPGRRPDDDDARDGHVRGHPGRRSSPRATWRATPAIPGSSP